MEKYLTVSKRKKSPAIIIPNTAPLVLGQPHGKSGIFIGKRQVLNRGDDTLHTTFNVFAAPQDLVDQHGNRLTAVYNDAVSRIAALKNHHGHNGARDIENNAAFYQAIREGAYEKLEYWFMPNALILNEHIYANKDKGALSYTFIDRLTSSFAHCYWSGTEQAGNPSTVASLNFTNGREEYFGKASRELSTRAIRMELVQ